MEMLNKVRAIAHENARLVRRDMDDVDTMTCEGMDQMDALDAVALEGRLAGLVMEVTGADETEIYEAVTAYLMEQMAM